MNNAFLPIIKIGFLSVAKIGVLHVEAAYIGVISFLKDVVSEFHRHE